MSVQNRRQAEIADRGGHLKTQWYAQGYGGVRDFIGTFLQQYRSETVRYFAQKTRWRQVGKAWLIAIDGLAGTEPPMSFRFMSQELSKPNPESKFGVPADCMPPSEVITSEERIAETSSLTHHTARGFAWMIFQAGLSKLITAAGQVVLAWYLMPEQMGVVYIAYMFSILPVLIQQGGLKEVLIARHADFRRWANPAFWMSMSMGIAGGIVMAGIAPVAAKLYELPELFGLLLVNALLFPLQSLSIVPMSHIQGQLRFRLVAAMEMGRGLMLMSLQVLLAWKGYGPYSIVLPLVYVAIATAIVSWWLAPVRLKWNFQIRRWRYLIGDSAMVISANGCELVVQYVGPFFLSIFESTRIVGLFGFALYHSTQATALITYQLGSVLFPALSKLQQEPQRQADAFLRAVRILSCIAMPACLMQAALIDPVVHLLFPSKWWDAIPLLQILSVAMAMRAAGWPAVAMLQAQRRFRTRLILAVISLAVLTLLVLVGTAVDGVRGAAIGTSLQMLIMEPLALYVAVHPAGSAWRRVRHALAAPAVLAVGCVAPAAFGAWLIGPIRGQDLWRCVVILGIGGLLFFPLFRLLVPDAWNEARDRIRVLVFKRRPT